MIKVNKEVIARGISIALKSVLKGLTTDHESWIAAINASIYVDKGKIKEKGGLLSVQTKTVSDFETRVIDQRDIDEDTISSGLFLSQRSRIEDAIKKKLYSLTRKQEFDDICDYIDAFCGTVNVSPEDMVDFTVGLLEILRQNKIESEGG